MRSSVIPRGSCKNQMRVRIASGPACFPPKAFADIADLNRIRTLVVFHEHGVRSFATFQQTAQVMCPDNR